MKKKILMLLFALSLIMSACSSSSSDVEIEMASTAAAQTVEARFTEMAKNNTSVPQPSATKSAPTAENIDAPTATPTIVTNLGDLPEDALVANLYSENIPDGTVLETGERFTKSWSLQNNGTYTWSKDYKLIYWDGNIMGGAAEYNFFDVISPGEIMTLPIQLLAPSVAGNYTGYWKIKSPSGYIFGVGEYNAPISVSIDVREADDIEYGITSVEYYMVRDPEFACPANVEWTTYATVSVSGPMEIRYQFYQRESDGQIVKQRKKWLRFTEAGTKTISNVWQLNHCVNSQPRYVSLVILDPNTDAFVYQYPEFMFINNCPDLCP